MLVRAGETVGEKWKASGERLGEGTFSEARDAVLLPLLPADQYDNGRSIWRTRGKELAQRWAHAAWGPFPAQRFAQVALKIGKVAKSTTVLHAEVKASATTAGAQPTGAEQAWCFCAGPGRRAGVVLRLPVARTRQAAVSRPTRAHLHRHAGVRVVCQRLHYVLTLLYRSELVRRWATCARRRTRSASRGRRRELYAHALSPTRPAPSNRNRR